MRHLKTVLSVLGAVTVLVLAANTVALAATGQALILGKSNSANTYTALTRTTSGTALKLQTASSSNAPLTVNGKGKVTNLNADRLDGLDSTTLRNRSLVFTAAQFSGKPVARYTLPLPSGSYVISYTTYFLEAPAGGVECYLIQDNTTGEDLYTGWSALVHTLASGFDPSLTGSGLVTKSATSQVRLQCNAAGAWSTGGTDTPIRIVATPTELVSNAAITPDTLN